MTFNSPLSPETLEQFLEDAPINHQHLQILRWLIWLPLLSTPELAHLLEREEKRVADTLRAMENLQLITHVSMSEPDTPRHFRYYVENRGLYVFAAKADPPLSVPRLVQAYAVDHDDLLARLVRPDLLHRLADIATRLIAEGQVTGYTLTCYQQPWVQSDAIFGKRQTMRFDAALLLRSNQGTEHACYVRMDTVESRLFREKRERHNLARLLSLRDTLLLQQEDAPRLLVVTHASRLPSWAHLLKFLCEERSTVPIEGGITILEQVKQGLHAPIWWPFQTLIEWTKEQQTLSLPTSPVSLVELLGPPVNVALAERFSQRATFAHLLTEGDSTLRNAKAPLPNYVGSRLEEDVNKLNKHALADALAGTKAEQREACALLSLLLTGAQKEILAWLARHPLLTIHDLAALLVPTSGDIRVVQRHMTTLDQLGLLVPFPWLKAETWQQRERYLLSDAALRYMAMRNGLPATSYLLPARYKTNNGPLSVQRGAAGLFAQMFHTSGVYSTISHLMRLAQGEQVRIINWKSAREAMRWYRHPFGQEIMPVRPDAELLYLLPGSNIPRSILLEYDRATTFTREYEGKFSAYADYQEHARLSLPPIVVITQSSQQARFIRSVLANLALPLQVVIVLETELKKGSFFQSLLEPT